MKTELKKRLINSIDFLRGMDFFKDHSNLSSEEILEKIFNGEIDYETQWFVEEESKRRSKERSHGAYFKERLDEHEKEYMKKSTAEIDRDIAFFDAQRTFVEDLETVIRRGIAICLVKKLARISRGIFQFTDIREEILEWRGKPPSALRKSYFGKGCHFKAYFWFKGDEQMLEFYSDADFLYLDSAIRKINELIKDTGYRYYSPFNVDYLNYVVLSKEEVEKLMKERGWRLFLP
jgi:hypothetical protein